MNTKMHLYYGEGKGKTTAAIGLAIRAAGAGYQVIFTQFMKGNESSELKVLREMQNISCIGLKENYPFYKNMSAEQKERQMTEHNQIVKMLLEMIEKVEKKNDEGIKRLIILDELTHAWNYGLVDHALVKQLIEKNEAEIVITGRNPDAFFMEQADYITEMKKVRHPYEQGLLAREGIEF